MRAAHVRRSRTYPVAVEAAYDAVLPAPLPDLFRRRYAAIGPIRSVSDQSGPWGQVGQTRRIHLADGASMHETLTSLDRPVSFGYRIDEVTGPLAALVTHVDGRWAFEAAGTGTRITWSWTLHPRGRAGALAMPVFARLWTGYARQALEEIESLLVP